MNTVNEELLLFNSDCEKLSEIRVVSLRKKQLTQGMRMLSECENMSILYLQNNMFSVKDLNHLQFFSSLKKIDLSDN
jgi:hypothetical protein